MHEKDAYLADIGKDKRKICDLNLTALVLSSEVYHCH